MFTVGRQWLLALLCSIALAAPSKADLLWGVNGHPFTAYPGITVEQQLDYLKDLGLKSYRVNISRTGTAPSLRRLVEAARVRGIEILPVLTPGFDLAKASAGDLHAAAYRFAATLVSQFKSDIRVWELGNELENFAIIRACEMRDNGVQYNCAWGPAGGVGPLDYYGPRWAKVSAVLKGLSEGTMSVDPTIRKALGTAGWGHLGAFKRMEQDGIQWDISVWHMYGKDPGRAFKALAEYKRPIWVTEFNHPLGSQKGEDAQAAGLKRWMERLRQLKDTYNVEAAHLYELLDETYWAPNFEAYMGLVKLEKNDKGGWRTGAPKPAYYVVKDLLLAGPPPALRAPAHVPRDCDLVALDPLDVSSTNQMAYSFCLILGRMADGGGLRNWTSQRERGMSIADILSAMLQSEEFDRRRLASKLSNGEFIALVYRLLLSREPDGADRESYLAQLDAGSVTRVGLARAIVGSKEFRSRHPILSGSP